MQPVQRITLLSCVVAGTIYGLVAYFTFHNLHSLPTAAFLFAVPVVMGAVPLLFTDIDQIKSYLFILLVPWLTILATGVMLLALKQEALLCIAVLALPFFALALLGTLVGWIVRAIFLKHKKSRAAAAATALLPLLVLAIERRFPAHEEVVAVHSNVVVQGSAEHVWSGLAEVDTIGEAEYRPGVFQRLGVPRPLRATVDRVGLGGHRTGEFDYGLRFDEVITTFDAPKTLAFTIGVEPQGLRPNSTERHAFEGGYFRLLDATYVVEPTGDDRVTLRLSSRYVMKTHAGSYGNLWARAVIGDFQDRVLDVMKRRTEGTPPGVSPATGKRASRD